MQSSFIIKISYPSFSHYTVLKSFNQKIYLFENWIKKLKSMQMNVTLQETKRAQHS